MKRLILFFSLLLCLNLNAADTTQFRIKEDSAGIVLEKDYRLNILTQKLIVHNKLVSKITAGGKLKGYRVQVISTSNREKAFKVKGELLEKFKEHKTYVLFQSPFFKVRIGNFLEKADADEFRKILMQYYPAGVFVVQDLIDYIPKEEDL